MADGLPVLLNFMHRDGWAIHCLAPDAKTAISPFVMVATDKRLIRLLRACGATDAALAEAERDMKRWGRGSVWMTLNPLGQKLLRISPSAL